MNGQLRLLWFNLLTDADDPVLGFTTVWLNAMSRRCQHLDVITMQAGRLAVAENVRVYSVGKERGYSEPRRAVEFYRILLRLLWQNRYDACFAHQMPLFAVMGALPLKLWRVPLTLWYAHKATSTVLRLAEKAVNHVVTASPESFRLSSRKTRVVGHGIDTDVFRPADVPRPPDRPFIVLSVSRIAPVKRLETMIEAAAHLKNEGVADFRLRLVGGIYPQDTEYGARLRRMIADCGLQGIVEFPGAVNYSQVVHEYQNADVMVNMSDTGSIDKAVLEAMACGLPVVTANEAFRPVLARWPELLLPPDDPAALAARVRQIAARPPDDRAALGRDLRQIVVEQHSLDRLMDVLLKDVLLS